MNILQFFIRLVNILSQNMNGDRDKLLQQAFAE